MSGYLISHRIGVLTTKIITLRKWGHLARKGHLEMQQLYQGLAEDSVEETGKKDGRGEMETRKTGKRGKLSSCGKVIVYLQGSAKDPRDLLVSFFLFKH